MQIYELLEDIFKQMDSVSKWQSDFIRDLFEAVFALRGRVNFTNLARFSSPSEQTFRRNFNQSFDWFRFNLLLISTVFALRNNVFILALDCTFLPKSGHKTWGLDRFWSGTASRAKRGLEASVAALIHTGSGQAFTLGAAQTPPGLSTAEAAPKGNRMSFYMTQLKGYLRRLPTGHVRWVVADGYYAKSGVFDTVNRAGCHLITKLRSDANLRYLYEGPQTSGRGAPKRYDGKVDFSDLARFRKVGPLPDYSHVEVYTQTLNSPHFKRNLRVVVLVNTETKTYVVLASSDTELEAMQLVKYYRLRFQIELIFRDAKQHAGLTHCQARSKQKLDFHLNMSLTAVSLGRASILLSKQKISMNSFIRRAYNRWLTTKLLSKLGLNSKFDLNHPRIQQVIRIGDMAA
jgi:hypothetical protein